MDTNNTLPERGVCTDPATEHDWHRFDDYRDLVTFGRWDWHGGNDL